MCFGQIRTVKFHGLEQVELTSEKITMHEGRRLPEILDSLSNPRLGMQSIMHRTIVY